MVKELEVVDGATQDDAVVIAQALPALSGNGTDDLGCGSCGKVLAAKLTGAAIHRMLPTDKRLILRCICGADNVVPDNDEEPAQSGADQSSS